MFQRCFISLTISLCLCGILTLAEAQVTITPFGLGCGIDRPAERQITLTNPTNQNVPFQVWVRPHFPGNDAPRRDFPGETLDHFTSPGGAENHYTIGLAWDAENHWMWNNDFHTGVCWALDPANDYQPAAQFQAVERCRGMALLNGYLYMVIYNLPTITCHNRDGDRFENLLFEYSPISVTSSQELGLLLVMGDDGLIHVYTMRENGLIAEEVGQIENWQGAVQNRPCASILWVDAHSEGQLWFNTSEGPNEEPGNWAWQIAINTDDWTVTELNQVFQTRGEDNARNIDGLGHDGFNLWASFWMIREIHIVDDGVPEINWATINPPQGVVGAESTANPSVVLDPADVDPGVYNFDLQFRFGEGGVAGHTTISALVSVDSPVGGIVGTVTQAWNDQPLEGASIKLDQYFIERITDDQGRYSLEEIPAGNHELTITAPGYLPQVHRVAVEEDGEARVDAALLHGEFWLSINGIEATLPPDSQQTFDFLAFNEGDGPLTFTTKRSLVNGPNLEPWTLRQSFNVGQIYDDSRIQGVVFGNDSFYVSGSGNNEEIPFIYVFDREGRYVRRFEQPRVEGDERGMRDLAWDGELIWGAVSLRGNQVFGITPEGEVIYQWDGPYQPTTAVAWDPVHEVLWVTTTTGNPVAFTREGWQVDMPEVPRGDLRIYGLAYWPDDPDGCGLYIYHKDRDTNIQTVHKANVETGEMRLATQLEPEAGGAPEGAFITNQYDPLSWVMMVVANQHPDSGGDRIDVWQLAPNSYWMQVDPPSGQIDAQGEGVIALTINTEYLTAGVYEGELAFIHDGFGGEAVLSVILTVLPNSAPTETAPPVEFGLLAAYPNPFNSQTRIEYSLVKAGRVRLELFDLNGRLVWTGMDGMDSPGRHSIMLDAAGLASGLYFARMEYAGQTHTMKLTLLR